MEPVAFMTQILKLAWLPENLNKVDNDTETLEDDAVDAEGQYDLHKWYTKKTLMSFAISTFLPETLYHPFKPTLVCFAQNAIWMEKKK